SQNILVSKHGHKKEFFIMKRAILFSSILLICGASAAWSQAAVSDADKSAITATALDYIEGWYEGNPERMERALHPDLAKRIVMTSPEGRSQLQQMSAMGLVQGVKRGGGKNTAKERQQKDVTILDVYENAASVKVVASDWIDYLHI